VPFTLAILAEPARSDARVWARQTFHAAPLDFRCPALVLWVTGLVLANQDNRALGGM